MKTKEELTTEIEAYISLRKKMLRIKKSYQTLMDDWKEHVDFISRLSKTQYSIDKEVDATSQNRDDKTTINGVELSYNNIDSLFMGLINIDLESMREKCWTLIANCALVAEDMRTPKEFYEVIDEIWHKKIEMKQSGNIWYYVAEECLIHFGYHRICNIALECEPDIWF